jgi:plasmid stabilization system protein ParE
MAPRYRILLSKNVANDLQGIFDYIARDSPYNAAKMIARILDAIDTLGTSPYRNVVAGQKPGLAKPVRSLPVWPYVVFFRVHDDQNVVRVLRVRHGARKMPKRP